MQGHGRMSHQNGLPPLSTQMKGRQSPYMQGAYSIRENGMFKEQSKIQVPKNMVQTKILEEIV